MNTTFKTPLLILSVIATFTLQGCVGIPGVERDEDSFRADAGSAGYQFANKTNPDGTSECTLSADSARDITDAEVSVSEKCAFKAKVAKTDGTAAAVEANARMMESQNNLLEKLVPAAFPDGVPIR
jgi:hypothetical protein